MQLNSPCGHRPIRVDWLGMLRDVASTVPYKWDWIIHVGYGIYDVPKKRGTSETAVPYEWGGLFMRPVIAGRMINKKTREVKENEEFTEFAHPLHIL